MSKKFLTPVGLPSGTTFPAAGSSGELFFNTTDSKVYVHDGADWVLSAPGGGGGSSLVVSETPPSSPSEGNVWYNSLTGQMLVYYDNFWVESSNAVVGATGPTGPAGPTGLTGATGPAGVDGTDGEDGGISIPQNQQVSAYTLAFSDRGKHISITTGGVTVPSGVFSVGDNFAIFNNSTSVQTITQSAGVTLRLAASTSTGNRSLAGYGLCTIICVSADVFVIVGAGVS